MTRNTTLSGKPTMPCAWSAMVHGKVRPMLTDDATWEPIYRGLVWAVGLFCGPVFLAVAFILGGSK